MIGALTTLLVLVKGLPLAYNRDLQEDKEPLFDAFDTVEACLDLAAVVVDGASLRADRIAERLDEGFLDATTLMEYLIQQGVPQRTAHEVIGHLVGLCERRGLKRLADLPDDDFAEAHPGARPRRHETSWASPTPSRRSGRTARRPRRRWRSSSGGGRVHSVRDLPEKTRMHRCEPEFHRLHRRLLMKFTVTIDRDEDGIWVDRMPCDSRLHQSGESREEALENIKDAIKLCLEVRAERGLPLTIESSASGGRSLMPAPSRSLQSA